MKKCFILLLLLTLQVSATTFKVKDASEISDLTNNNSVMPGDTIIMSNGIWHDQIVKLTANGAEGDTVVLKAETPGRVILTGRSTVNIAGKYIKVDGLRFEGSKTTGGAVFEFRISSSKAYNSRLTNSSIVDYNPASKGIEYKWVSIYGKNNRVDHCYFKGKTHDGATLVVWMPDSREQVFHRIDHNYFGERPPLGKNGGETIRIGTSKFSMSDASCTVEYNYFERCDGEIEIISNKTGDNLFRRNTFFECQGTLTFRHGNGSTVKENFFLGNRRASTGGIRIIGEDHKVYNNYLEGLYGEGFRGAITIMNGVPNSPLNRYFQVKNAFVGFNTIVDCRESLALGIGSDEERTLPPINSTIVNNLISSTGFDVISMVDTPQTTLYEGNIFWGSDLGVDSIEGIQFANPDLIFGDDSLWRINESSIAYNSAVGDYADVSSDFDGQLRTDPKDVGADEVSTDPVTIFPLKASDVGPGWLGEEDLFAKVVVSSNGLGKVEYDPVSGIYEIGTQVELTAIPEEGSTFESWSGDIISESNPVSFVVNNNMQITANFKDPNFYKIAVWVIGSGQVKMSPKLNEYMEGSVVEVTAIPSDGWQFLHWGGTLKETKNPDTLIMDSDKGLVPTFEAVTSVDNNDLPTDYKLYQNYPNPFNPTTQISYSLKESGHTEIKLYNILGKVVDVLVDEFNERGFHKFNYDASGLTSGVYFISIESGNFKNVKKMILSK